MKPSHILLVILLAAITAFGVVKVAAPTSQTETQKEPAFERVMRTGEIKCVYGVMSPPRYTQVSNKAKPEGILPDIMEAIGAELNLKIVWDEQTTYGLFAENLRSGKQDVFCSAVWRSAARAHKALLTSPLYYTAVHAYVREGDARFKSLQDINKEEVTISVIEGSTMQNIAQLSFPKAKRHLSPLNAGNTDTIMDVATSKADVVLFDYATIENYNNQNPNKKLIKVPSPVPVRLYADAFPVNMGEWRLREMLDAALEELRNNGTIDRILTKYGVDKTMMPRARDPYAR